MHSRRHGHRHRPRPSLSWTLNRRQFLGSSAGATGLGLITACGLNTAHDDAVALIRPDGPLIKPAPGPAWLRDARVAGFEAFVGQSPRDLKFILDKMADEHVSVVEVDPELSAYLTPKEFHAQVDLLHLIAQGCHMRGMRVVAYYPTLEVLTKDADKTPHTMHKDHPDWIQVSINGKPNVFVGGGGRVFWVAPGEESAWMCPTSGYVDYFNDRVATLAKTDLDGVWGDVPLFSDIVGVWPCVNPTCNALFKKDSGHAPPKDVNWNDPVFRRWVEWRHGVMWGFEQAIYHAAKKVRPDFEVIIETVTMDYNASTLQGLDGASRDDGHVYRVWEVDAVSDATGMRHADHDDWVSMAVMMRHGRFASHPRPSWIFTYGLKDDDAEHVMALAIVAGNNPYESKIPVMNTSTGHEYRKRMFAWLEQNVAIYRAEPATNTALLFSSASRDFLDQNVGVRLYTSFNPQDKLWWSTRAQDSAKALDYVGDYRGSFKILMHAHIPHDIITEPHVSAEMLARYNLLVLPSIIALSDEVVGHLVHFVDAGGVLVVSGNDPGLYKITGEKRSKPALAEKLGLNETIKGWEIVDHGKGRVYHSGDRTGKTYFNTNDPAIRTKYREAAEYATAQVELVGAPHALYTDIREDSNITFFLCANLDGLGDQGVGAYTPRDASFEVKLRLPKKPASVTVSVPDAGVSDKKVPFTYTAGHVSFQAKIHALFLATIRGIA